MDYSHSHEIKKIKVFQCILKYFKWQVQRKSGEKCAVRYTTKQKQDWPNNKIAKIYDIGFYGCFLILHMHNSFSRQIFPKLTMNYIVGDKRFIFCTNLY